MRPPTESLFLGSRPRRVSRLAVSFCHSDRIVGLTGHSEEVCHLTRIGED